MNAPHWRAWTGAKNADAHESLLKDDEGLPGLRDIQGYRGGYILRKDEPHQVEFVVVNLFDSLESAKRFAGPDSSKVRFRIVAKPDIEAHRGRLSWRKIAIS